MTESIAPDAPPKGVAATAAEVWSRRLIWLAAAALLLTLARNGFEAWKQYDRLRALRCDEPVFEFGRAFRGRVVEHTLHVVNLSRQPVTIERVTASCGCTTLAKKLEGTTIEPQATFDVPVRLDLANSALGEIDRPVTVKFVGEPRLELTVKLVGVVEAEWEWEPETVVFENLQPDSVESRTVTLTQHPEAPWAELGHIAVSEILRSEVARVGGEAAREWRLTLTTVPPLPPGRRDLTVYAYREDSTAMIGPIRATLVVEN